MMNLFEDQFPGNASTMDRLLTAMRGNGVTAFSGAGTSMPNMPSWAKLVRKMIDDTERDGKIDFSAAAALRAEETDFLYVIDEIYNAAGAAQTRSRIAQIFSDLRQPTISHGLLTSTDFKRMMTLNYDAGLELSFAERQSHFVSGITALNSTELDRWTRSLYEKGRSPILHWHGLASDAQSIILSGLDYLAFYDQTTVNKENLRKIFGTSSVLLVGFGFSDPFIQRELNSLMQPIQSVETHFAIIGVNDHTPFDVQLERRRYSSKYKMEAVFYPVRFDDAFPDHAALTSILAYLADKCPKSAADEGASKSESGIITKAERPVSYRSSLFTISERQIYCEPNISYISSSLRNKEEAGVKIEDLIADNSHCSISASHEFGLTNLGRRLEAELSIAGKTTLFRDAESVPKYSKAIRADKDFSNFSSQDSFVVILDDFSAADHQRILKELSSLFSSLRIIILQRAGFGNTAQDTLSALRFKSYILRGFSRTNIRSVITTIVPEHSSDDTSIVVDKVYSDLIQLCIPLTPSNVIMYASVLCKDGSFSPVSRLHIVDRFVAEALQRASDAYADTFNSIDKIELIAKFCYELFQKNLVAFQISEWNAFCIKYKSDNLVEFDSEIIISDLLSGRVLHRDGSFYSFRYRMFYSYFIGRHISARQELLDDCLCHNRHLEVDGLVEVLCGTLADSSAVLDDLSRRLTMAISSFYKEYPIGGLDSHAGIRWEYDNKENALWEGVADRLQKGPVSTQELDDLKGSIQAERRTDDQKVSIIKFIASEQSVTSQNSFLYTALGSVKHSSAASKTKAASAVIDATILAYEVANIFIPLIAERKYVSWNGFTYINLIEDQAGEAKQADVLSAKERSQNLVAYALPGSISRNAADTFGSRKLGPVFLSLMKNAESYSEFKRFTLFCLLLRSKPSGWQQRAKEEVDATGRHNLYLRHMLNCGLRQYREEINTERERQSLQEVIASIQLRREVNLKSANATQIKDAILKMDKHGYWDGKSVEVESADQEKA